MQHVASLVCRDADESAESTTIYTFRLDGSHSAPICDAGSCESKPRAEPVEGSRGPGGDSPVVRPRELFPSEAVRKTKYDF